MTTGHGSKEDKIYFILFIYLFVSGNKAHKHHKHEQKKTDRNTDMQTSSSSTTVGSMPVGV